MIPPVQCHFPVAHTRQTLKPVAEVSGMWPRHLPLFSQVFSLDSFMECAFSGAFSTVLIRKEFIDLALGKRHIFN